MELYLERQPFDGSQLCAQVDPELFFPEEYDNVHEAKAVCRSCPLTTNCLEYAMAHPELEGIWGATTPHERRLMRRRKRARV